MISRALFPPVLGLIGFLGVGPAAAETFRDCTDWPVMVKIKPGSFMMGSTEVESSPTRTCAK